MSNNDILKVVHNDIVYIGQFYSQKNKIPLYMTQKNILFSCYTKQDSCQEIIILLYININVP